MLVTLDANGMPDFDIGDLTLPNNENGFAEFRADPKHGDGPMVTFIAKAVHSQVASISAGRPQYLPALFVKIQHPGERDWIERQATHDDCRRWPRQYRYYLEKREGAPDGTPLSILFPHLTELVESLNHQKVKTVEQLAHLSDTAVQTIGMGGHEWREKAKRYLERSEEAAPFVKLEEQIRKSTQALELAERRERDMGAMIAQLQQQLAQMTAAMAHMPAGGQIHMGAAPGGMIAAPYTGPAGAGNVPSGAVPFSSPLTGASVDPVAPSLIEDESVMPMIPGGDAALTDAPRQGGAKRRH